LATFCEQFLASFGEQFGYKIFLHLATLWELLVTLVGLGRSPSRNRIWCVSAWISDIWSQQC